MPPPTQAWAYGTNTASWNSATSTLTDTVTAGGAVFASFAGQCYANLNTPLPGWPTGNPA